MSAFLNEDTTGGGAVVGKQAGDFAARVVAWQRAHGRHELPWQNTRDPYRVWLSETMLQQTQVRTVLRYYPRFLARFPGVRALAAAPESDVMALWSGLGYYARARHLHACAREVVARHGGEFPRMAAELACLPGIGRSTAAAIAAFCFGERVTILDANVRRVLARVFALGGDLSRAAPQRALWQQATALLPDDAVDMPAYTQGLMDLGATVCTPRAPACAACPLRAVCAAAAAGNPEDYPVGRHLPRKRQQDVWLLDLRAPDGAVLLVRRPGRGIWPGLHCLPEFVTEAALRAALPALATEHVQESARIAHGLTHRQLDIHVVTTVCKPVEWTGAGIWYAAAEWPPLGLPAPVRAYLQDRANAGQRLL